MNQNTHDTRQPTPTPARTGEQTKPLSQLTDAEAAAAGHIRIVRLGSVDELLRRPAFPFVFSRPATTPDAPHRCPCGNPTDQGWLCADCARRAAPEPDVRGRMPW